jgi:hypothetical protein
MKVEQAHTQGEKNQISPSTSVGCEFCVDEHNSELIGQRNTQHCYRSRRLILIFQPPEALVSNISVDFGGVVYLELSLCVHQKSILFAQMYSFISTELYLSLSKIFTMIFYFTPSRLESSLIAPGGVGAQKLEAPAMT